MLAARFGSLIKNCVIASTYCKGVPAVLPTLEKALEQFEARPHWGKLFTLKREKLRALYPKFDAFWTLARELDPRGKLRNEYLKKHVFGDA